MGAEWTFSKHAIRSSPFSVAKVHLQWVPQPSQACHHRLRTKYSDPCACGRHFTLQQQSMWEQTTWQRFSYPSSILCWLINVMVQLDLKANNFLWPYGWELTLISLWTSLTCHLILWLVPINSFAADHIFHYYRDDGEAQRSQHSTQMLTFIFLWHK